MEIVENFDSLMIDLDGRKIFTLRPMTGIVLRDGFDKRTEQQITTANDGKQQIINTHSTTITEFWLKTVQGDDIPIKIMDDICVLQGHIVTVVYAEQSNVDELYCASLINHNTKRYDYALPFVKDSIFNCVTDETRKFFVLCLPIVYAVLVMNVFFTDYESLKIYTLLVGTPFLLIALFWARVKTLNQDEKITFALKKFAASLLSKISNEEISVLRNYYEEEYHMKKSVRVENSYGVQIGDNNYQSNFSAREINLKPSKETVGKAIDVIEKQSINDNSFTHELRAKVEKELKNYILGQVKTLTKSTAEWVGKLVTLA